MSKCYKIIALMALILCIVTPAVSAINVSFADPDATVHRDVYVYNAAGTLQGVYNTTSAAVPIVGDSLIVLKPQYSSPLDDPGTWLSNAMSWMSTNVVELAVAFTLIGFILTRR